MASWSYQMGRQKGGTIMAAVKAEPLPKPVPNPSNPYEIWALIIENWQSHKKTVVRFAPSGQLTVFSGKSRSGKSAIMRMLRWILDNSPAGVNIPTPDEAKEEYDTGYCRAGASYIRGTLIMSNGIQVIREKTRSTNRYIIIRPGASEPEIYEGFGTGVPLEVQQITGVRPVEIGDKKYLLNLARQHEGIFLGSEAVSKAERARVLGKLAGTEEIDIANKETEADIIRRRQDVRKLKKDIADLETEIKRFSYLPNLKAKVDRLIEIHNAIAAAQTRKAKLENIRFSLKVFDHNIKQCEQIIERWRYWNVIAELVSKIEVIKQRLDVLIILRQRKEMIDAGLKSAETVIIRYLYLPEAEDMIRFVEAGLDKLTQLRDVCDRWQSVEAAIAQAGKVIARWACLEEAETLCQEVLQLAEKRRTLIALRQQLQTAAENIETARHNVVVLEQRISELEGAYKDTLMTAGVCPLCGSEVTPEILRRVI